jgi:hypothetical protein
MGEDVTWEVNFTLLVQDWELESFSSFLDLLYAANIKHNGTDKIC